MERAPWALSFADLSPLAGAGRAQLGYYLAESGVCSEALLVLGREGGGLVAVPGCVLEQEVQRRASGVMGLWCTLPPVPLMGSRGVPLQTSVPVDLGD